MSRRDRLILAFLAFALAVAWSLELYWYNHRDELVERSSTELFAWLFKVYGDADRAYYDHVTPMSVGQEWINIFVTQLVNLWLMAAIIARRRYRPVLQLLLGSYVAYSVVLYFAAAHLTGYPDMRTRSAWTFGLFYGANLPWLVGYAYLAWDGARELLGRPRGGR